MLGIPRLQACNPGPIPRTYELFVLIIYIFSNTCFFFVWEFLSSSINLEFNLKTVKIGPFTWET